MESKVISIYDYHNLDLSPFAIKFNLDEDAITREIESAKNRESKWEAGSSVYNGDIAVCSLSSKLPLFNKEKVRIVIGSNLLNKDLEQAIVGMKKGECKVVALDENNVLVNVLDIMHRIVPDFDDELAKKQGIEGVESVLDFREYLINQQKNKAISDVEYTAVKFTHDEVINKSDIVVKKKDLKTFVDMELSKYRVLSSLEGLELEKMDEKDFQGKIPVKSYHELLSNVQINNLDTIAEYLIGKVYAERKGYCPDKKEYEKFIKEYVDYWHGTEEEARKITTYDYFVLTRYTNFFYNEIHDYVKENIIK